MEGPELARELAERAERLGIPGPGEAAGGTIPGDVIEGAPPGGVGAGRISREEQEARMERLEAELDEQEAGVLVEGVHVGTPAGGITEEALRTGAAHWGEPREEE